MNRQMWIEMRNPLPFLIFIISAILIGVTDYIMVSQLGENTLDSELTFLEREKKRAIENNEQEEDERVEKLSLVSVYVTTGAVVLLLGVVVIVIVLLDRQAKKSFTEEQEAVKSRGDPALTTAEPFQMVDFMASHKGRSLAQLGLGILFLIFGYLYFEQGERAMQSQKSEFTRIVLIKEEEDTRRPWAIKLDEEVIAEYEEDAGRKKRGVVFMVIGGLIAFFAMVMFQSRRSRS